MRINQAKTEIPGNAFVKKMKCFPLAGLISRTSIAYEMKTLDGGQGLIQSPNPDTVFFMVKQRLELFVCLLAVIAS